LKVLGIITARGGSKGIPGKNLKLLAGKPLLTYTVETARRSGVLDRVILSTEDERIAAAGATLAAMCRSCVRSISPRTIRRICR